MKKKIFLAVFLCCGMFAAMAQTAADSLAIVSADWQTEPLQKGMLYKKAVFSSLYGVPQEVSIFEISPKRYRFDVLVHNPKEETSVAARGSKVSDAQGRNPQPSSLMKIPRYFTLGFFDV